jgi:hypothetical protein
LSSRPIGAARFARDLPIRGLARRLLKSADMQSARFAVWAALATFAIGGIALAADALVESDEERVDDVADAMVGGASDRRVDAVLAWVDPSRVPVVVDGERYAEDDGDPAPAIRDALAPLDADRLEVVQRSVSLEGDRATVALRVRSEGDLVDVQVAMRRDGQAWLVSDVRRL